MKEVLRAFALLACVSILGGRVAYAQSVLHGTVLEDDDEGAAVPLVGANVYWLGTSTGTVTGTDGSFHVPLLAPGSRLIVSAVGFAPDTLAPAGAGPLRVVLRAEARQVGDVEVIGERSSTTLEYMNPAGVHTMNEKELFKAACCNLSESFETNPSIDVAFTDAITGTRQIEMLGLAGTYSQITVESMPAIRGLTSNVGLTYIPGTWISSIQVSKGVGSVANGYESITGQINVELRKPAAENESRFFLNMYGNEDLRLETNLHYRERLGNDWSTMTMLHVGSQRRAMDGNDDRFLDLPLSRSINALQRFAYAVPGGFEGQFTVQYAGDTKEGGTLHGVTMSREALAADPGEYGFRTSSRQWRLTGKTGHVYSADAHRSLGVQYAFADYRQEAYFGARDYNGSERTGYLNVLYETDLGTPDHHLRLGAAFLYDRFAETFAAEDHRRIERVPGVFGEYTFTSGEAFTAVAGLRADKHNLFGAFVTPRLHLRYAPSEDWVLRAVAGRGERSANVFAENMAYLASARAFSVPAAAGEYPFDPEVAWNAGFNVTRYFTWHGREGTIVADFYRTDFERQVVVDVDQSPQAVVFRNLDGRSFSNSIQLELNLQPIENLDTRLAYRFLDVQQTTGGALRQRPLVARHRAFLNLGYTARREGPDDPEMLYDLTLQWFGPKRMPSTAANPEQIRVRDTSPAFMLVNAQITRSFTTLLDLYLGVENLLGFRQDDPILDPGHPGGRYFDGSLVWGPVSGRMAYLGLRLRM
jgi:outer membrane receptor for ferrienterochelin and colicins